MPKHSQPNRPRTLQRAALWALLAGLTGLSSKALAQASGPDELNFCRNLQAGREALPAIGRWSLLRDSIQLMLTPGRLVGLSEERLAETPFEKAPSDAAGLGAPAPEGRRVIFSFAPPKALLDRHDTPALRGAYEDESLEIRSLSMTALRLIYLATPEDCARAILDLGFDHRRFMSLLENRSRFRVLEQRREAALAEREIRRALRRSRLGWELVPIAGLEQVHEALSRGGIEDVILIGHGTSDGRLLDSWNNVYPKSFFADLSPDLRSISIFSCHSLTLGLHYDLRRAFAEAPTRRSQRAFYLSPGSRIGTGEERVPVRAFRSFLRRLESKLVRLSRLEAPDRLAPARCSLSVPGLALTEGTFGILLNGRFAGAIHEGASSNRLEWPCRWLREGRNVIELRSLGVLEPARALSLDFSLELRIAGEGGGGESVSQAQWEHFFRRDGSHQGSKAIFQNPPR